MGYCMDSRVLVWQVWSGEALYGADGLGEVRFVLAGEQSLG